MVRIQEASGRYRGTGFRVPNFNLGGWMIRLAIIAALVRATVASANARQPRQW